MKQTTTDKIIKTVTMIGAIGMLFFGLTAWLSPLQQLHDGAVLSEGITTYSRYLAARNVSIAALLIFLVIRFDRKVLGYFLVLMGIIQAFDFTLGLSEGNVPATVAPFILSVAFFVSSRHLLTHSK